jgi:DsbC/DsbD-like thiol-disulfide interchange protein
MGHSAAVFPSLRYTSRAMKLRPLIASALVLCAPAALAQFFGQHSGPRVTVAPIAAVVVARGGKAPLDIALRINRGYHINSNRPHDDLLLPTVVYLDPPEGIEILKIAYPQAEELAAPFANQKLSVYSGEFEVTAEVRVPRSAALGTQRVRGQVRYQACDNRQCFPPKTTPIEFDVRVVRGRSARRHSYTPASPHIR